MKTLAVVVALLCAAPARADMEMTAAIYAVHLYAECKPSKVSKELKDLLPVLLAREPDQDRSTAKRRLMEQAVIVGPKNFCAWLEKNVTPHLSKMNAAARSFAERTR